MVIAIFVFAFFGRLPVVLADRRRGSCCCRVIAGIAYELIRFAGKHADNRVADDVARARSLAAAADDARADARPDRGLDPRAARGAAIARAARPSATRRVEVMA